MKTTENTKAAIRALALIALIIAASFLMNSCNAQQTVQIVNKTEHAEAAEIAEILADMMNIDTLCLLILPLEQQTDVLAGAVMPAADPHCFVMYLNKALSIKGVRIVMSHEFIHIKQYDTGDLDSYGDIWEYRGSWGSLTFTDYLDRPYERDAREQELYVNRELVRILKLRHND